MMLSHVPFFMLFFITLFPSSADISDIRFLSLSLALSLRANKD